MSNDLTIVEKDNLQVVVIFDGARGKQGLPGDDGDQGDPGRGLNMLGNWVSGTIYCPGDIVTDRSSLVGHVTSFYIQKTDQPCSPSTMAPWQDPTRWAEAGAQDWDNAFGGIWEVYQINHGFTRIGQPITYSAAANRYILASSSSMDNVGIALVREVIDADRVILQSSGEVPNIDPAVIYPDLSAWQRGRLYYVSTAMGRLELTPPTDHSSITNPILIAADDDPQTGGVNGIALPWAPVQAAQRFMPVGWSKFYYTATAGQTVLTGPDNNAQTLAYTPGVNTDVFVNGLNRPESAYTATDGVSITLGAPLSAGDIVEVWTPSQPLSVLVPSTTMKLDSIEALFDGTETVFPLLYGGVPVAISDETSAMIWLDATAQEPQIDYELTTPGGATSIEFKEPPEPGTRFWGVVFEPSDGNVGGVIDGGTW